MNRRNHLALAALVAATAFGSGLSCQGESFGDVRARRSLTVELVPPSNPGTREAPLPVVVETPVPFRVVVRAIRTDGALDTAFTGYVRVSAKPGAIPPLSSEGTEGRNVLLTNGESAPVDVDVVNAYGTTFIVADDLGYVPADPLRLPPPSCANGVDDDGDGRIDFPADEGCAFANDDAEQGGSFAEGVSAPIFFASPRVADVRGLVCIAALGCSSSGATPYPKSQVSVDTGYRDTSNAFAFNTVVSRISSDGFYASDVSDARGGFSSIFAFNFSTPPGMRVCDRFKTLAGTASEFFGFTQLSYPTWTLEEWDPKRRTCLVPAPENLSPGEILDKSFLLRLSGSLARVETTPDGATVVKVTPKFGPGDMPKSPAGSFVPAADATNCDLNQDGKVDFTPGGDENACAQACTNDPECTEFSNYKARGTFRLTVLDAGGQSAAIQADSSASPDFDALANKGVSLRSFTGTLTYFSGGSQYTIEARCSDDVITDLAKTPFGTDDRTDLNAPPPPLACVKPRTELELNPQ